jgi:hypothetical protein
MSKSITSKKSTNTLDNINTSLDAPNYKVKHLVNGKIDTIYVFSGKPISSNQEDLFNKIFTDKENEQIKADKINIKFCILTKMHIKYLQQAFLSRQKNNHQYLSF